MSFLKREKYFSSAVTPSGKKLCSRRQENDSKTFWEAKKRFFVKFWGAKVSMHSWRGHALNTVRVLFRCVC